MVIRQRIDLTLPIDIALPDRLPHGLMAFQRAVLGMNQRDARDIEHLVSGGKGLLAGYVRRRRIPDDLQVGMIDRREDTGSLLRGRDVARSIVFETDNQAAA